MFTHPLQSSPPNEPATPRQDTHVTHEQSPVGAGVGSNTPSSMPRAEDDEATRAGSPEFNDRPGSGKHIADRMTHY
jgi:hypothetical protein